MKLKNSLLTAGCLTLAAVGASPAYAAVDAAQAQELIDSNKCTKCHTVEKSKSGPAFKKVAAKYQGRTDGEENIIKTITTGRKVKLADGSEEEHKIIKTQDPAKLKNLAQWVLSQ